MSAGEAAHQLRIRHHSVDSPNKRLVIFGLGDHRASFIIDGRKDVERSKDPGKRETQHSNCQVTSRTDPVAGEV